MVFSLWFATERVLVSTIETPSAPTPTFHRLWLFLGVAVLLPYLWLYLANALAPEGSPDGLAYHLGLVARYDRSHGFGRIPDNFFANIPQGLEMLFLFAFTIGKHSAAALVHFTFLLALSVAIFSYGKRFLSCEAGIVAALLFLVTPVVGKDATVAYNDVATAAAVFAAFLLLQIWNAGRSNRTLLLCGMCAGFAFTTKYPGALMSLYGLAFLAWTLRDHWSRCLRGMLLFGSSALLIASPWLLKNWLWVGNPVAPVLNRVFLNPYFTVESENTLDSIFLHWQGLTLSQLPLQMTLRGTRPGGLLGPVFLLAPLALLALSSRQGRLLLSAALLLALPAIADKGTRFLIPALPFLSLAMASVFLRLRWNAAWAIVVVHALTSWPAIIRLYADPYHWSLESAPWSAALRLIPEDQYLAHNLPAYNLSKIVERAVPPGERIYAFNYFPASYCDRDVTVSWLGARNLALQDILLTPVSPDLKPRWQFTFHFPGRRVCGIRVCQQGKSVRVWSINEVRFSHAGKDISPESSWRPRAFPFPWTASLALDRRPLTRWSSNQSLYPGAFWEVTFPNEGHPIDQVNLLVAAQPSELRLSLQTQTLEGTWEQSSAKPVLDPVPPASDLRKAATAELLGHGIRFLLIQPADYIEGDVLRHPDAWNLTLAGEAAGAHLYRILKPRVASQAESSAGIHH